MSRHRACQLLDAPPTGFAAPTAEPAYAPDLDFEPIHQELSLAVDAAGRHLRGLLKLTAVARTHDARTLVLDAVDLDVESVEGESHDVTWRHDGDRLHVQVRVEADAPPPAPGDELVVEIRWTVTAPITGLHFGGDAETGFWAATDHETERARYWLPCVDHPSVRTTTTLSVAAAESSTTLANGALRDDGRHPDGGRFMEWVSEERIPSYLLCFVTGELVACPDGAHDGRPIAYYAPAHVDQNEIDASVLHRTFGRTGDMIAWMTERLGRTLPWPKYYQFAVPGIGGAMENISLVSWDAQWLCDERQHAELGWLVDVVNLHELAHTWFGDRVVCRDFAHSWLKESWATYMEVVWLEDTQGPDRAHVHLLDDLHTYTSESDERYARPIVTRRFESSWHLFDGHLYPGGAWRLHILRHTLGEAAFWAGVTDYLDRYDGEVVETDDFRRCMEAASGRSLARFFDEWLHRPGYPKLEASWSHADGAGTLVLEQKQVDAARGIGLFRVRVEVAVEHADGRWTRHSVAMDAERHTLRIPAGEAPKQVVLDPDCRLLAGLTFDPGADLLTRTLTTCPHVRPRVDAARALAKRRRPAGIRAIRAAWDAESEWGVRRWWARALGEAGTAEAAVAIAELLAEEADPRVMSALTEAAGRYREPALAEALAAWLDGPDRPYRAAGAALKSLGLQRDPRWTDRLVAAASAPSWGPWVARGALEGLGELGTPEAVSAIRARLAAGDLPSGTPATAATALAAALRRLPRPERAAAVELLVDLTRSGDYAARLSAGRALAGIEEPGTAGALDALLGRLASQDGPTIRRIQRTTRREDELGALRKQVEGLTDQLRKLERRLEDQLAARDAEA